MFSALENNSREQKETPQKYCLDLLSLLLLKKRCGVIGCFFILVAFNSITLVLSRKNTEIIHGFIISSSIIYR